MQKQSLSQSFRKFIYHKTKKLIPTKEMMHTTWTLCKSKFSQPCINYRGSHLRNAIVLSQNTTWNNPQHSVFLKKNWDLPFHPRRCYMFILILCYIMKGYMKLLLICRNRHPIRKFSTVLAIRSYMILYEFPWCIRPVLKLMLHCWFQITLENWKYVLFLFVLEFRDVIKSY